MENNQVPEPVTTTPEPPKPGINLNPPNPVAYTSTNKGNGGNKILIVVMGIVLIAVIGAGAYFFMTSNKFTPETSSTPSIDQSVSGIAELNQELEAVPVEDINADFTEVDEDLKGL